MTPKSALKIPQSVLRHATAKETVIGVDATLLFGPEDVQAAIRWANERRYNYDDLGDLLTQWALDGNPSGDGPDIDTVSYRTY